MYAMQPKLKHAVMRRCWWRENPSDEGTWHANCWNLALHLFLQVSIAKKVWMWEHTVPASSSGIEDTKASSHWFV